MAATDTNQTKLTIPVTREELQDIRVKAAIEGVSMSEYGRRRLGIVSQDESAPKPEEDQNPAETTPAVTAP